MKRFLKHIGLLLGLVLLLSSCTRRKEVKVIPRSQLAKIYAEMLVTDQWIMSTSGVRLIADTSLVYEPILEKHGYTTEDYLNTVNVYMDDPERFARILRESGEILDRRIAALKKKKAKQEADMKRQKELDRLREMYRVELDYSRQFPCLYDEPYVHYYDSLTFEADSVTRIYRMKSIERADTLYDRIRMVVPADTAAVADSLVAKRDTVVRARPEPVVGPKAPRPPRPLREPDKLNGMKVPEMQRK